MTTAPLGRRPLRSRGTRAAAAAARWLAGTGLTPNQVSVLSVAFAAAAGAAVWAAPGAGPGGRAALLVAAALGIQLRLLCNLLDGMLAVEHGRKSRTGDVYNDLPDRLADVAILVPAGYAVGWPALGWAAGLLAVFTAYVRVLAGALGATPRYSGPMAKQHRMFVMTAGCLAEAVAAALGLAPRALEVALWVVAAGSALTAARRARDLLAELESR